MALRQLSEQCKSCEYKDNCDEKRMIACGVVKHKPIQQPFANPLANPLQQDMLVKHDYRKIKIAENRTITIDLEKLKKQAIEDFYKSVNRRFSQGGV